MTLELYQNKTSIFQSDLWFEFSKNLYGFQCYKFKGIVLQESLDMIYVSGVTKNQLEDLSNLVKLIEFIKDINTEDKKILIDFQILENDIIANDITNIMRDNGLISTTLHVIPRQRLLIDLQNDIKSIQSNYKNKTLNDIKRAEKNGIIVVENWDINSFYEMYIETSQRQNFPVQPIYYFEFLCNSLREHNKGKLLFSTKEGYPYFSSVIIGENNGVLYYLYTGSRSEFNRFNGSSVLQNYIIKWAKNKGHLLYDLMGVRNNFNFGPTKFKLKFSNNIVKLMEAFTLNE